MFKTGWTILLVNLYYFITRMWPKVSLPGSRGNLTFFFINIIVYRIVYWKWKQITVVYIGLKKWLRTIDWCNHRTDITLVLEKDWDGFEMIFKKKKKTQYEPRTVYLKFWSIIQQSTPYLNYKKKELVGVFLQLVFNQDLVVPTNLH